MSTRTGFPRMDWDTGFLADPKFQHLRDLLPDPVQFGYAGFCYLRLAADSWRTCDRHPIEDIVRGIEPWAVDALVGAGLLDEAHAVTGGSYEKWVGSAIEARSVWKDRQKRHRASPVVTESHAMSRDVTVTERESPPARAMGRNGREETVGTVGLSDDETRVFAFLARFGASIREDSPLGRRLLGLIERRGVEDVLRHAGQMSRSGPMSDRQWVLGLENAIEAIPTGKEGRALDLADQSAKRADRIAADVLKRRQEWEQQTGKAWPDAV